MTEALSLRMGKYKVGEGDELEIIELQMTPNPLANKHSTIPFQMVHI